MTQAIKFEPHIRMFWSNSVDVILQRPQGGNNSGKVGSFTTYGKIMSFVMRFFFGIEFEKIQLEGRIHYVPPKEWEELRRNVSSQNDDVVKMLNDTIEQVKTIVPSLSEIPASIPADPNVNTAEVPMSGARKGGQDAPLAVNLEIGTITPLAKPPGQPVDLSQIDPSIPAKLNVNTAEVRAVVNPNGRQNAPPAANLGTGAIVPLPQPPVQQKINILSLCPGKLIVKLEDLEAATLGDEFQPVRNAEENAHAAILFTIAPARVQIDEFEVSHIEKTDLKNTPLALVFFERNTDRTRYARPPTSFANAPLLNKKHRAFHLIGSKEAGLNKCKWNDQQCIEIRHFLREKALVKA